MNKKLPALLHIYTLSLVFILAGCYKPIDYPQLAPAPSQSHLETEILPGQYHIIGKSVENKPILSLVLGQGPEVIFILATIHGNEPAGTPLLRKLAEYLKQHPIILKGRKIVLLPVANPDGMANNSRFNANGVDVNRNFQTNNRINNNKFGNTPLSEPEARIIKQLIEKYPPDRIVSIHQPLGCIDYDGPATNLAVRMSRYCDLPIKKLGPKPGSLGSYAGVTLGIPIITFEMLEDDSELDSDTLWQRYGKALLAAIIYPETVK